MTSVSDEWLWGWDPTPGIVSLWAEPDGRAYVWRRVAGVLVREDVRFRSWALLASLDVLDHARAQLRPEAERNERGFITFRELEGPGALRYVVRAHDGRALVSAILKGASARAGRRLGHPREMDPGSVLVLPPDEQYLVASGRTYFKDLAFDDLRRMQLDLETTGLDWTTCRIFLVAIRGPDGNTETLEAHGDDDEAEADLLVRLAARVREIDADVIENHNLHGFDVPFIVERCQRLGVPLVLGRIPGLRQRPAARGVPVPESRRRFRYTIPGRELIDSMDAVRRHDFSARDLPGHGLKAVARHLGLAGPEREYVPGARIFEVFGTDPERIRRYAKDDVREAGGVARLLGGAAFALARMAPRRYERLADAGAATGVLDPLLVRAYLRSGAALPAHEASDGTAHQGAALHLFATGVATRVVKADVASLYPSLMRQYRIGPARDRLGALVTIVDRLVTQRLAAKARAKELPPGSPERFTSEALSAAMKLVVNSAYGYLGASSLTRFADVHAANEVTRRGREVLTLLCRSLAERGVTLLEADTDGVYFAVPEAFAEADEQRVVREVGALLPPLVQLDLEARYAAMLSHEPKNYALLPYGAGKVVLRGVAFRSSRTEPFAERFLREALGCLLAGDLLGIRRTFVDTVRALRERALPTLDVTSRVRLSKTPEEYLATRDQRKELAYEAVLGTGRTAWRAGERVRVYRAAGKRAALLADRDEEDDRTPEVDPRDYDVAYYENALATTFASRLERGLSPDDFAAIFADPGQLALFPARLAAARPVLTVHGTGLEQGAFADDAEPPRVM
ncbi:MAG: putative polymerase [Labilithrix sp.]|nr:putative polymerase [Labilithrix sp.]